MYHNILTSAPVQEYENALKRIAIDSSNYQTLHKRWHDGTWKVPGVVALPGLGSEESGEIANQSFHTFESRKR